MYKTQEIIHRNMRYLAQQKAPSQNPCTFRVPLGKMKARKPLIYKGFQAFGYYSHSIVPHGFGVKS
jgi:hypothetical protein